MKLLAVDTALGACSVALLEGDQLRAHIFEAMERGHAESAGADGGGGDEDGEDRIRASRPALPSPPVPAPSPASAWALPSCAACGLRCKYRSTGVTTLEAMAAAAMAETGKTRCAAIHDARRGEVYLLLKDDGAHRPAADRVAVCRGGRAHKMRFGALRHRGNRRGTAARESGRRLCPVSRPPTRCVMGGAAGACHANINRRAGTALSARARCKTAGCG